MLVFFLGGRKGEGEGWGVLFSSLLVRSMNMSNSSSLRASRTSLGWMVFLFWRAAMSLALLRCGCQRCAASGSGGRVGARARRTERSGS